MSPEITICSRAKVGLGQHSRIKLDCYSKIVLDFHNNALNEARYLAWNCELKTKLGEIVSHVPKSHNYRQIVTKFGSG